ncbi:histone deacetylase family protein [Hydrogenovibrio halophilus]|uniref:histone deacetylase family protein n=1 Tax=Hydrogenovibrio halophilus TaxID=373391 RepID=UPI000367E5B5|nr:histone deacetylase [Hydrogenovibrio halophilus]
MKRVDSGRRELIKKLIALGLAGSPLSQAALASDPKTTRPGQFRTGVVLDPLFFKHNMPDHPEGADRLKAIDQELEAQGLWDQLTPIQSKLATEEELLWAHDPGYIDEIRAMSNQAGDSVDYYDPYAGDTYINAHSFDAARMAAGSHINMNLAVYDRTIDHGFSLLRPPGHHALKNKAMGFCIFNSDIIAAKALQKYRGVKKIAIIDFDVHHGNGTQDLSDADENIMAISIHQHPFWPMTGGADFTGNDQAKGTVVNLPFQEGAGDTTYLNVYDEIIHPKLEAFEPEQIIVFAGYDAHWLDPLAQHRVSVLGFNRLVKKCLASAKTLCQGRISFSLGGGYELEPLAKCTAGTLHTLLNNPEQTQNPIGLPSLGEEDFSEQIAQLKSHHLD